MWAVTCIALSLGAPSQELSYFSKDKLPEGSVISISLRGKDTYALVLACLPVTDLKQNIRSNTFSLKKITSPKAHCTLSKPVLRALFESSMTLASPPGSLIAAYVPAAVLEARISQPEAQEHLPKDRVVAHEILSLYNSRTERVSEYKRLVRESLARGMSLLIITPTVIEAQMLGETLMQGIQDYCVILHGSLTKKKMNEAWKRALLAKHPVVIVGTPLALTIPRGDITTIILERETARSYMRGERPYSSTKIVAEAIAKALGARYILAGTIPSIESACRKRIGEVHDLGISPVRLPGAAVEFIDLRAHKKEKRGYDPLTPTLIAHIERNLSQNKKVVLFAARRGLAPTTVCDDCGTTLTCPRCSTSLVLHTEGKRKFLCHHCGQEESASIRCGKCSSWRLTMLGIAIDSVAESVARHFPNTPLHIISADIKTKEEKTIAAWHARPGILLMTEKGIPYLPDEIETAFVVSVDALLGIPEYSASERLFALLNDLKSRTTESFVVQTRDPNHRVMKALLENVSSGFIRDELTDRERFKYPPFMTLIKFTAKGKAEKVAKEVSGLLKALEHLSPHHIEGRISKRGEAQGHVLIRLKRDAWVDQRLLRFIRTLPPHIEVRVNPLSILTD